MSDFENSNSNQKIDRRREPRFPVEINVIVVSGKNSYRTKTLDISAGGCRLRTPVPKHFALENLEIIFLERSQLFEAGHFKSAKIVDDQGSRLSLKPWMNRNREYFGS